MNQQLGDMARDYFHFVTKFFAVIDVSASHIYHSALVISPQSSVIREHYYCEPFWHAKPRVLFGLPISWGHARILHGHFVSHTWSPCGHYFSTLSGASVQEWNATTLEKRSNLHPCTATRIVNHTAPIHLSQESRHDYFPDVLAYSPDGHSLACFFDSVIVIWDLQTGGMINEIQTNLRSSSTLVWSSDGTTIYTPSWVEGGAWVVAAYSITSGTEVYTSRVQSSVKPYLWLHDKSLRVLAMVYHGINQATINILEIQPNSINKLIESFPINNLIDSEFRDISTSISFSPSTYQISAITPPAYRATLLAFDIQSSKVLLKEMGYRIICGSCFSPDGKLLVASGMQGDTFVWEYTPEQSYTLLMKLPGYMGLENYVQGHQFSPSSILLLSFNKHLDILFEDPRPNPPERDRYYTGFFNNGTCVIAASGSGSIFTSIGLQKGSSQSIDTKFKIEGLAITGSILLIKGKDVIAGWKLTTEGTVDKVLESRSEDCDGRLWTKPLPPNHSLEFSVRDPTVVIESRQGPIYYYHKETGVELDPATAISPCYSRGNLLFHPHPKSYHLLKANHYSNDDKAWIQEGWVKFPEREHQHQFWLPPEWKHDLFKPYWIEDVTTLFLKPENNSPVIIKF